jgi:hypothetical protein
VTTATDGCIEEHAAGYGLENLKYLGQHDGLMIEGGGGRVPAHRVPMGRFLTDLIGNSSELIGSPPANGRTSGFLPDRARWQAGGVGAFHPVDRKTAHERNWLSIWVCGLYLSFRGVDLRI